LVFPKLILFCNLVEDICLKPILMFELTLYRHKKYYMETIW
jgi:hypothetical protein